MEAALCLGYGPMPGISLRMPSRIIGAPAYIKLHFGFNHSSISVSRGGLTSRRRCHHFYIPGPLALDRSNSSMPTGNEKDVGKVVREAIGASLALSCALIIIGCGCKMIPKAIAGLKQQVSQEAPSSQQSTPQAPRKMALKSLLDVTVNIASKEGRKKRNVNPSPLALLASKPLPPSEEQIDQMKEEAVSMMKRGQPDKALDKLKKEFKKYEPSSQDPQPLTAYNLRMALVEILICQGKYVEALEFLSDEENSNLDVRPSLYKAILCTMLDRDIEAKTYWEEFAESDEVMPPMPSEDEERKKNQQN